MASDQKSAKISRTVSFKSKGGSYSAIFMGANGDLFQEYEGSPTGKVHPEYSASNPLNLNLTVTSSRSTGVVTPQSVKYTVAGIELAFNTSGACTTTTKSMNTRFRLQGGVLQVIGRLTDIADGAGFIIQAEITISALEGSDTIVAHLPVSISPYTAGDAVKVTIAPGDTKNFTITSRDPKEPGYSVILKANIYDGDWVQDLSGYSFRWYQLQGDDWKELSGMTSQQLTVSEGMVDTYSDFRVVVSRGAEGVIGSDTQGVLDATDPLDIQVAMSVASSGSATPVSTADATLDDSMPNDAYLLFQPKMVTRGSSAALSGVTWDANGKLITPAGLIVADIPLTNYQSAPAYKITVEKLLEVGGVGDYDFVFGGTIA